MSDENELLELDEGEDMSPEDAAEVADAAVLPPAEPDEEDVGSLNPTPTLDPGPVEEGADGEASEEEVEEEEKEEEVAPLLPNVSTQATMVAGSTALAARKQQERAVRLG